jgi:hypothetical protein
MEQPITFVISQAWAWFIAACVAIVTIVNAWKAVREVGNNLPDRRQDELLGEHESRLKAIEDRLAKGDDQFIVISKGSRITQEALLALMSHAINGNDVDKLQSAKDKLEKYLIEK